MTQIFFKYFCKKVANHQGVASRFAFGKIDTEFYKNNAFSNLKELERKATKGTGSNTNPPKRKGKTGNENQEVKSAGENSESNNNNEGKKSIN